MGRSRSLGVLAALFVIAGTVVTLENLGLLSGITRLWPSLILCLGIGFSLLFFERKKNDPVLIWLGTFFILVSIFFFYLNYTSWSRIARLWPVFVGITAGSFLSIYVFLQMRIFMYLSLWFLVLFAAFYLVFGVSLRLWPTALIIFGLSLFAINYHNRKGQD